MFAVPLGGRPGLVDLGRRYKELPAAPFTLKAAESGMKAASVSMFCNASDWGQLASDRGRISQYVRMALEKKK